MLPDIWDPLEKTRLILAPLLTTLPLAIPPLATISVPPLLMTALIVVPDTVSVPPLLTTVPLATPPATVYSFPPLLMTELIAVPDTYSIPPLLTVVLLTVAPTLTVSIEPELATNPLKLEFTTRFTSAPLLMVTPLRL